MPIDRRTFLTAAAVTAAPLGAQAQSTPAKAAKPKGGGKPRPWRRIAVEEAFFTPELCDAQRALGQSLSSNLDLKITRGTTDKRSALYRGLSDFDERLRIMDEDGVAMHLLSHVAPGVQMFDVETANRLAIVTNDHMAGMIAKHPTRFAGLATMAPQDPKNAVREMERAIKDLKLSGFIINSHTNNEYLDLPKFWPLLEAAEALDRPIYLHPRAPADTMAAPYADYDMYNARWGFQAECSVHVLRMIYGGVFDRFPKLQIVIGHMGEGLPGQIWRIDNTSDVGRARRANPNASGMLPSDYLKRNFYITSSGVLHGPILRYTIDLFGIDRVMWAIDYPFERSKPSVQFMDSTQDVTDAEREKLYHLNAERVFRLPTA